MFHGFCCFLQSEVYLKGGFIINIIPELMMAKKTSQKEASKESKKGSKSVVPVLVESTPNLTKKVSQDSLAYKLTKLAMENNKAFGAGTARTGLMGDMGIKKIKTGVAGFDYIFGGIPEGKIVEIFGPEGTSKTTFCAVVGRAFRKAYPDKGTAFIDVEQALDTQYCARIGYDIEDGNNLFTQPDCLEDSFELMRSYIKSGLISLIILDSVAALTPRAEVEGEIGKSQMGIHAKMMSITLKRIIRDANKNGVTVVMTNQLRDTMGYGKTTTGGNALKFYSSLRIETFNISDGFIKDGENVIGKRIGMKAIKNKGAAPYRPIELSLIFGDGYDEEASLLDVAIYHGVILKGGGGYLKYAENEENICQGKEAFRLLAKSNPEIVKTIQAKLDEKINKDKKAQIIEIDDSEIVATEREIDFKALEKDLIDEKNERQAYFDKLKGKKGKKADANEADEEKSDSDSDVETKVVDLSLDEDLIAE